MILYYTTKRGEIWTRWARQNNIDMSTQLPDITHTDTDVEGSNDTTVMSEHL